ncbi:MAG: TetR/AcrR family transcriptional regulator [Solirubrobacterales bacterium]
MDVSSSLQAARSVPTPWGSSDELRARRLRPGPAASREASKVNQRERLYAAMVACAATRGYRATSVADLVSLAGVSRATYYTLFRDRADCFQQTIEVVLKGGLELLQSRIERSWGNPEAGARAALEDLLRLIEKQPAAAYMSLVEAYASGRTGAEPVQNAFEQACEITHRVLQDLPDRENTPAPIARAIVGGVHRIVYRHLDGGEADQLPAARDPLWSWARELTLPERLQTRRKVRPLEARPLAPTAHDSYENLIRSFAFVVADRGFSRLRVSDVAAQARISNATFYRHFRNKYDAFIAALDLSGAQIVAASLPAARRAGSWQAAVIRALEGVCDFLAAEPAFAHLRAVEVYTVGPEAIAHRDRAWGQILEEFVPDEVRRTRATALKLEASSGAIFALIYEKVRRGEMQDLRELPPLLSYIILAPLVGKEQARTVLAQTQQRGAR